jgi:pyruvate-formate lyase-activating enzyme
MAIEANPRRIVIDLANVPAKLQRIATSFTTRCNLRCVYCPEGSHPEEFYGDMGPELLAQLVSYSKTKDAYIDISFYGDSTFHPKFYEFAREIVDAGVPLVITSNFAKMMTPEEISVIARCKTVSFSFDTQDRDAAKALRKGLDLRTLLFNILRVRAHCLKQSLPIPPFTLHVVLVDQVVRDLPNLIALAASLGVQRVGCNELADIEGSKGTDLRNIADLRGDDLSIAIDCINEAAALANRLGIAFMLSGQSAERINAAARGEVNDSSLRSARVGIQGTYYLRGDEVLGLQPGMTRRCTEPWTGPILNPKGDVYACCTRGDVMGTVGNGVTLEDVHNGETYRKLRISLLTGENLDTECRLCHMAPPAQPAELQAQVLSLFR